MALTVRNFIPFGTVVAIGTTDIWMIPGTSEVKMGYVLCDGQPFSSLPSGKYHPSFTGNRPNLTNSRFLAGSTTANIGITGGIDTFKLTSAQMPLVTLTDQSVNHTHYYEFTPNSETADHRHSIDVYSSIQSPIEHTHGGGSSYDGSHSHTYYDWRHSDTSSSTDAGMKEFDVAGGNLDITRTSGTEVIPGSYGANTHYHTVSRFDGASLDHSHGFEASTKGNPSVGHYHGFSITTGPQSASHTHSFGNSLGSQSIIDNKPLFFSVIYVMKVK